MFKEAEMAIKSIKSEVDFIKGDEDIEMDALPINSESSKKRIKRELHKRLRAIGSAEFLVLYKTSDDLNKKLILFYAACKFYPLIADFMLDIVLNKWYNLDFDLAPEDFQNFLYRKMDTNPELFEITQSTRDKLGQVIIRMLRELGLTLDDKLQKKQFDIRVLEEIARSGDIWFLEAILLNDNERQEIIER